MKSFSYITSLEFQAGGTLPSRASVQKRTDFKYLSPNHHAYSLLHARLMYSMHFELPTPLVEYKDGKLNTTQQTSPLPWTTNMSMDYMHTLNEALR